MKVFAALAYMATMAVVTWHVQRARPSQVDIGEPPMPVKAPAFIPPRSQFYMDPKDFPANRGIDLVHPLDVMPNFPDLNVTYKAEGMRVPNIVHYTFFTPEDDVQTEEPLLFLHYLGIRSTIEVLKPDILILHHNALPHGEWWDEVAPYFTLNKVKLPSTIFGKPMEHIAHRSDLVRLLALRHYGGIYMDLDMIAIRPFDDLMYAPVTMGFQRRPEHQFANGCFLTEPRARFFDLWLQSYELYDASLWDYNSGAKPMEIAKAYPDYIQALNGLAFFWPTWWDAERLMKEDYFDFHSSGQYGHHAWYRMPGAHELFNAMTPMVVLETDTSFYRLVRPFLGPHALEVYAREKAERDATK